MSTTQVTHCPRHHVELHEAGAVRICLHPGCGFTSKGPRDPEQAYDHGWEGWA